MAKTPDHGHSLHHQLNPSAARLWNMVNMAVLFGPKTVTTYCPAMPSPVNSQTQTLETAFTFFHDQAILKCSNPPKELK